MDAQTTPDIQIYDPHKIMAYALAHALSKSRLVEALRNGFRVTVETVFKWGSINDCSKRRNPIGACVQLFTILWNECRPAAFQIQAALKEAEMSLQNNPTRDTPPFDALEFIQQLRKATHTAEQLQAINSPPSAYSELASEVQAIGSLIRDRLLVPSPPSTPAITTTRKLTYNAKTPEAFR